MIGRLALVLTLSSIRSSRRFTVDACSIMSIGVVKTIFSADFPVLLLVPERPRRLDIPGDKREGTTPGEGNENLLAVDACLPIPNVEDEKATQK
jgi:hypothetical protein